MYAESRKVIPWKVTSSTGCCCVPTSFTMVWLITASNLPLGGPPVVLLGASVGGNGLRQTTAWWDGWGRPLLSSQ